VARRLEISERKPAPRQIRPPNWMGSSTTMSEKKSAFRSLTQGTESARLADSVEPLGQLAVPTLEERARLFLRAVHGEDFPSGKLAEAKTAILNAMAGDIAAKSNSGMPEGESVKPSGPPIESGERHRPSVGMSAPRLEEPTHFGIEDSSVTSTDDRQEPPELLLLVNTRRGWLGFRQKPRPEPQRVALPRPLRQGRPCCTSLQSVKCLSGALPYWLLPGVFLAVSRSMRWSAAQSSEIDSCSASTRQVHPTLAL